MPKGIKALTPLVFESENAPYVTELELLIKQEGVHNIAITGDYGVGKSSVLAQLKNEIKHNYTVKTISFLTIKENKNQTDNQASPPNTSPVASNGETPIQSNNTTQQEDGALKNTDTIQQENKTPKHQPSSSINLKLEILKQLFNQINPAKVSKLPYGRIDNRLSTVCKILSAAILAIIIALIIPIQNSIILFRLSEWLGIHKDIILIVSRLLFIVIVILPLHHAINYLCKLLYGLTIRDIHVKGIGITLDKDMNSFDDVFEQIVYIFKKGKYQIVIFEDIDRCDNKEVYYALRQLCADLNARLNHKIVFIYALKDALITPLADRTKLFDAIVPIIPFFSPNNGVDFVQDALGQCGYPIQHVRGISKVISRYATDARSVTAICNTAMVMKQYFASSTIQLGDQELIAMALIREALPEEYSNLLHGNGILDRLFTECHNKQREALKSVKEKYSLQTLISATYEQINRYLTRKNNDYDVTSLGYDGLQFANNAEGISSVMDLLIREESISPEASIALSGSMGSQNISISDFLECIPNIKKIRTRADDYETERRQLLRRDIFEWADETIYESQKVPKLLRELIKVGFIDESYRSYLTPFKGCHETPAVRNFKLNNLRAGVTNYDTIWTEEEVELIIEDLDKIELRNDALYNYSIFTYLATRHLDEQVASIIDVPDKYLNTLLDFFDAFHEHYLQFDSKYAKINPSIITNSSQLLELQQSYPPFWLLAKIALGHYEDLLDHILSRYKNNPTYQGIMFALVMLQSPVNIPPSGVHKLKNAKLLNSLDLKTPIRLGLGIELAALFCDNDIALQRIPNLPSNSDFIIRLLEYGRIEITYGNLRLLSTEQLKRYLDKNIPSSRDLATILSASHVSVRFKEELVQRINELSVQKNDEQLWEAVQEIIEKGRLSFTWEQIDAAREYAPDYIIIAMCAWSNLNKDELKIVVSKLTDPVFKKFNIPGSRIATQWNTSLEVFSANLKDVNIVNMYTKEDDKIKITIKRKIS